MTISHINMLLAGTAGFALILATYIALVRRKKRLKNERRDSRSG